jgi:hypothetical protein
MSRRSTVSSMVATLLIASGLSSPVAAAGATAAPGPVSEPVSPATCYEDPLGDVLGGIGPDIVAVAISEPDASRVSFAVELASEPPLGYDAETLSTDALSIILAADVDAETADWHLIVHGASLPQAVETGAHLYDATIGEVLEGVVDVAVDGPTVTLTVERALLGDPSQLAFAVAATTGAPDEEGAERTLDVCPDDEKEGVYTFTSEES